MTEHCWHKSDEQHAVADHRDDICCNCGTHRCVRFDRQPIPGHGPWKTPDYVLVERPSPDVGPCKPCPRNPHSWPLSRGVAQPSR